MHHIVGWTIGAGAALAASALIVGCGGNPSVAGVTAGAKAAGTAAPSTTEVAASTAASTTNAIVARLHAGDTEMIRTPNGRIPVHGEIGLVYIRLGGPDGVLGFPKNVEDDAGGGGTFQEFDGAAVYWSPRTGAHVIWGEIRKAWDQHGATAGPFGYPTTDEHDIVGGKEVDFAGGKITLVDGQTTVYPKKRSK